MTEKVEEWVGRVEWMSKVNRQLENDVGAVGKIITGHQYSSGGGSTISGMEEASR